MKLSGADPRLRIDSQNGGKGDVWMRLASLFAMSEMKNTQTEIIVDESMLTIAQKVFGDRLMVIKETGTPGRFIFTSRGLKDLVKPMAKGKRFLLPYALGIFYRKKNKGIKDYLNFILLHAAQAAGFIRLSRVDSRRVYQGFAEISMLKPFKKIDYNDFTIQLGKDWDILSQRLHQLDKSSRLTIPGDLPEKILVFPTGTGRQFIPAWWAQQYLPGAYYAFFAADKEKQQFQEKGLTVIEYYAPGDIIVLAREASQVLATDSFPSHLIQYLSAKVTVALTESPAPQVISPAFKGKYIPSMAPCHPCLHLDRGNHPYCEAGYKECLNWRNPQYSDAILVGVAALKNEERFTG